MTNSVPAAADTFDLRSAAIAGAEERMAMLRRLASLGMRLAEEVCERAINSPYHPELKHEPARAFATVSRAVRLTLVLQAKVEAALFSLRHGDPIPPVCAIGSRAKDRGQTGPARSAGDPTDEDFDDAALGAFDRARESLREDERFDEVLARPFDDCVAAIRADLGLAPGSDVPSTLSSAIVASALVPIASTAASSLDETFALRVGAQDPPSTG